MNQVFFKNKDIVTRIRLRRRLMILLTGKTFRVYAKDYLKTKYHYSIRYLRVLQYTRSFAKSLQMGL